MNKFLAWPSEVRIPWSENFFISAGYGFAFLFPAIVILVSCHIFKKRLTNYKDKTRRIISLSLGAFAFILELWFELALIFYEHADPVSILKDVLITCRFNMYLIFIFTLFNKVEWLSWIFATTLFGGAATVIGMPHQEANFASLFRHGYVLFIFPTVILLMYKKQFTFDMYIKGYIFSLVVVAMQIGTNYAWDKNAGELREDILIDNPLVGWVPYGGRIILWVTIVMIVQNVIFFTYRYSHHVSYEKENSYWNDLHNEAHEWKFKNLIPVFKK